MTETRRQMIARLIDERAKAEKSLMARGVYTTAADDSRRNS